MKQILIYIIIIATYTLQAQGTNMMNNRVHPELEWKTISTENFNIHYHQGIEEIAKDGAIISEHVLPTLLNQMDMDTIPTIDVIFTTEDEIMNGFAIPTYQTFIWVDQNDAAQWLEKEKWLEQVLSHELQHIVYFHKTTSWLKLLGVLFSGAPGWLAEGLAEYETESWRPYRADLAHKSHIIRNKTNTMDPHHDGFSKLLYWADRFGDSTIVKTLEYRNDFKLFSFSDGFKKATGITVKQFNEDWRRHMNTYYYGYRSQKESYNEIGTVFTLPIKATKGFNFFQDSSQIAIIGLDDKKQGDISLFIAERDTTKEKKRYDKWVESKEKIEKKTKKTKKDSLSLKKSYSPKVIWKKEEIDFGDFHPSLSWSSNGSRLAYSKYHHGENQSLIYDIKVYDKKSKKSKWITKSKRATYPVWIDNDRVAFVSHQNSIANIFISDLDGNATPLTNFTDNTQILYTAISPDGADLAFAMSPENGNLDIYTLNINSKKLSRLTTDQYADLMPVWHPSGTAISYTSNTNGVPNIHTINLSTKKISVNSDIGDGIWTKQWMPNDSLLLVTTLNTVDSVRLVKINPFRSPTTSTPFSIRDKYSSWLDAGPDVSFVNEEIKNPVSLDPAKKYKFTKHMRNFITLALPFGNSLTGLSMWQDALARNMFMFVGNYYSPNPNYSSLGISYQNAGIFPGLFSIGYNHNLDPAIRIYNKANMIDFRNGISVDLSIPYNFGEYFSSNHTIDIGISIINHDVVVFKETDKKTGEPIEIELNEENFYLPVPEEGNDGYLSLGYKWTNLRPHQRNFLQPSDGFGVKANMDYANKSLFGDFSYTMVSTDVYGGFKNFYMRIKSMAVTSGKQPNQNLVGLTNDSPIYLAGAVLDGVIPETHNPRGWDKIRIGDSMVFGSMEIRLPVVPGALSINLISDFGNAWTKNTKSEDWIHTAGYEFRLGLGLIFLSGGEAQTIKEWNDNSKPNRYFRATLIKPF